MVFPSHRASLCNNCGACIGACPAFSVYRNSSGVLEIDINTCISCGKCVLICQSGALSFHQKEKKHEDAGHFDVIITGGGPAGLCSAYHLALSGISVMLIERKQDIESPLNCAEGISLEGFASFGLKDVDKKVLEQFCEADGFYSKESPILPSWVSRVIEGGVLVSPSGLRTVIHHPKAGFILDRKRFLSDICAMACSFGARILTKAELLSVSEGDSGVMVSFSHYGKDCYAKADYFISSDGVEGSTLRALSGGLKGTAVDTENSHTCAQYVLSGVSTKSGYPEFYTGKNVAPGGYAWAFPKGDNLINAGVGIVPKSGLIAKEYLDGFIDRYFPKAGIIGYTGGVVPCKRMKTPVLGRVLFTGDAAGLADPLSGGGIANAFTSGRLAASLIVESLRGGEGIKNYPKLINKAIGRKLDLFMRFRKLYERLDDGELEILCNFIHRNFNGKSFNALDIPRVLMSVVMSDPRVLLLFRKI
jgi:digeranylgeranylglycerophospholipid reductase